MLGNQIVIVVSALQVRPVEVDECRTEIVFIHKFDFSVDGVQPGNLLAAKPADWQFNRSYGWLVSFSLLLHTPVFYYDRESESKQTSSL
jgi:hypothetical protein